MVCPLAYCKKGVTDLWRHLKVVHKWPKEKARGAMAQYGIRKKYALTSLEERRSIKIKRLPQISSLSNFILRVDCSTIGRTFEKTA